MGMGRLGRHTRAGDGLGTVEGIVPLEPSSMRRSYGSMAAQKVIGGWFQKRQKVLLVCELCAWRWAER